MKTQLTFLIAVSLFTLEPVMAQQTADPLMKIDAGIQQGQRNLSEMNRVLDDQDKKSNPIRPYFSKALADAQDYILAGKFDKAKKPIDKLHEIPNLNTREEARLHLIDSWYFGGIGDQVHENEALVKLMPLGADNIESKAFVDAGIRLLKRQYNAKDYGGAIETLGYLRKSPDSAVELAPLAVAINKLDELAAGTQNIVQHITANEKGEWTTKLLRPSFYLENIKGTVATVDFTCENKTTNLPFTADSMMSPPASWGSCTIKINASPSASYDFVQAVAKPG